MTALLLLLAAAPADARFVLEVSGFPLAELHVRVDDESEHYEATHFLEEGPQVRRHTLKLSDGTPEVFALLTPPSPGCREVVEERTGALEKLCVAKRTDTLASGTLNEHPFTARYVDRALSSITVGSAKWRRVSTPTTPSPKESPFVTGVAAPGVTLTPAFPGATWLAQNPVGSGKDDDLGRTRCLVLARRAVKELPGARVSVGLVVQDGRAFPHAWVTTPSGAMDPSVLPDDEVLSRRRYLEVPVAKSGDFFLRLFDGALQLR